MPERLVLNQANYFGQPFCKNITLNITNVSLTCHILMNHVVLNILWPSLSCRYYPSPVMYQKPLYISVSEDKGCRGYRVRSRSVDAQRSLNRSLGRAIATASSVREMSDRMVHSLSSGLRHMSPLAKSCTYWCCSTPLRFQVNSRETKLQPADTWSILDMRCRFIHGSYTVMSFMC